VDETLVVLDEHGEVISRPGAIGPPEWLTPFHTAAEVDAHTEVFAAAVAVLIT
jgi:hypothetical protein